VIIAAHAIVAAVIIAAHAIVVAVIVVPVVVIVLPIVVVYEHRRVVPRDRDRRGIAHLLAHAVVAALDVLDLQLQLVLRGVQPDDDALDPRHARVILDLDGGRVQARVGLQLAVHLDEVAGLERGEERRGRGEGDAVIAEQDARGVDAHGAASRPTAGGRRRSGSPPARSRRPVCSAVTVPRSSSRSRLPRGESASISSSSSKRTVAPHQRVVEPHVESKARASLAVHHQRRREQRGRETRAAP
jgi:hypothetical protein